MALPLHDLLRIPDRELNPETHRTIGAVLASQDAQGRYTRAHHDPPLAEFEGNFLPQSVLATLPADDGA